MDELDTLLQDFTYLKSLEHKHRLPTKLDRKLHLPDRSCIHILKKRFAKTGEITFRRLYKRPIARRCFETFLTTEGQQTKDNTAIKLVEFCRAVDDIGKPPERGSEITKPENILDEIAFVHEKYVLDKTLRSHPSLWKSPQLDKHYQDHLSALRHPSDSSSKPRLSMSNDGGQSYSSITDLFKPFENEAKEYLAGEPWERFIKSDYFVRYAQWKQLELNMKVREEDFDIHRILGRGGFGEVFGCRKRDTGALFAMKQMDKKRLKSEGQELSVIHERNVLAEMTSEFVTILKYAFHDKDKLYLVMDLLEGGDLAYHLKAAPEGRFTEDQARFYAAEISLGLEHLHSLGFLYRDLKPANVLLSEKGHARISDMGLVRDCTKKWPTSQCGTVGYMAPEVMTEDAAYNFAADWFSFGCTVYELLVGRTPFYVKGKKKDRRTNIAERARTGVVEYPNFVSKSAVEILSKLLTVKPEHRLGGSPDGSSDFDSVQQHQWFSYLDWGAIRQLKIEAPIIPDRGQVNAKQVYEIGRDHRARDARRVKVTDEENRKYYSNFDHIMSHQWQREVLPLFPMISVAADKADHKRTQGIMSKCHPTEGKPRGEVLIEGYMMKQSTHSYLKSWNKRYIHVFADRIEWRIDEDRAPRRITQYTDCEISIDAPQSPNSLRILNISIPSDGRKYNLKAFYESDEEFWFQILNDAYMEVKGSSFLIDNTPDRKSTNPHISRQSVRNKNGASAASETNTFVDESSGLNSVPDSNRDHNTLHELEPSNSFNEELGETVHRIGPSRGSLYTRGRLGRSISETPDQTPSVTSNTKKKELALISEVLM